VLPTLHRDHCGHQVYPNVGFEEHADLAFYHKKKDGKQQFLDNLGSVLSFECTSRYSLAGSLRVALTVNAFVSVCVLQASGMTQRVLLAIGDA
jgi:hypothetical protein